MYFSPVSLSLASAFFFASAHATYLNNDLSFGHNGKISPNMRAVPNWHLMGKPNPPEILSNKLVLTPPVPGNQRGAAWTEKSLQHSLWNVDVDFRATGPERGGGNFNIWYVRNGREEIGTSSIYTAGRFDGLALVIDQYAGSGGFIRGFLNDGSTEYKSHHSVDSLAFGHCTYSYRNLGRPSRLAIRQGPDTFRVEVDGKLCFDSPKIKLPVGNYIGITAASAENPDSFEVFKVVTTTDSHVPDVVGHSQEPYVKDIHGAPSHHEEVKRDEHSQQQVQNQQHGDIPSYSEDAPASQYHSSAEQFADLHNRLQLMMKHISTLNRDLQTYQTLAAERHDSLMTRIHAIEASVKVQEGNPHIMRDIQSDVRQTKADLHNALDAHVAGLKTAVRDSHHSVLGTLARSGTGLGKFVLVVILSQVVVVGAYVIYKRRKSGGHMKYL